MDLFKECLLTVLSVILTTIAGYIGLTLKKEYTKYINNKTKKDVVKTCVKAVEQIYTDIHGEEKLNKCVAYVKGMLETKGITITHFEARMLIESAVNTFNAELRN